ncbi:MAG: hypothetical protein RLZZ200_1840 [Pseudomonadota bacterium]
MRKDEALTHTASEPLVGVPFLVGVVGHRDLLPAQLSDIRRTVSFALQDLAGAVDGVKPTILCPMADGADLLVADVALGMGLDIVVLLTFPEDMCRAELSSDSARALFDKVLARATRRLELPLPPGTGPDSLPHGSALRDAQYAEVGRLLANHCALLLAIWNGQPTTHVAGTARVLESRRGGLRSSPFTERSSGLTSTAGNDLVFEIRCGRTGDEQPVRVLGYSGSNMEAGESGPILQPPPALLAYLRKIAGFNADCAHHRDLLAEGGWPLGSPDAPVPAPLARLDRLFVQADLLGSLFRRRFLRALMLRYSLWAAMASLLFAFERVSSGYAGLAIILVVLAIFMAGRLLASGTERQEWHRKSLDYRALAESLRVEYYWELAGLRNRFPQEFAHDSLLQKQDSDLEWIRGAMRTATLALALEPVKPSPEGFARTLSGWIGDDTPAGRGGQLHYYGARSGQLQHKLHRIETIERFLLGSGLGLALGFLIEIVLVLADGPGLAEGPRHYLLWTMALITVYAGILEVYVAERADRPVIRQYLYMHSLFSIAARELPAAGTDEQRLGVLHALGQACLAEHAHWTLSQRDKAIQGLKW